MLWIRRWKMIHSVKVSKYTLSSLHWGNIFKCSNQLFLLAVMVIQSVQMFACTDTKQVIFKNDVTFLFWCTDMGEKMKLPIKIDTKLSQCQDNSCKITTILFIVDKIWLHVIGFELLRTQCIENYHNIY